MDARLAVAARARRRFYRISFSTPPKVGRPPAQGMGGGRVLGRLGFGHLGLRQVGALEARVLDDGAGEIGLA